MISKNRKINEIFRQFLYAEKLKFNEIEKKTGIRSNELAYLIKRMVSDGILKKEDDFYFVTSKYEKQIPLFPEGSETVPLPVVLVACIKKEKILLIKRKKRAYKDCWSLPGGRIETGETIKKAALRVLKEKTFIDGKFISINAVLHEHYSENKELKNAFILFFTKAIPVNEIKEKDDVKWLGKSQLKGIKIIPSDLWLIQKKLNSRVEVKEEVIEESGGSMKIRFLD